MHEQFLRHISNNSLCTPDDRVLLTVSGGVDSMVMLDLFQKASYRVGIAHCNFQLRGAESDGDEALVKEVATAAGIPFYTKRFDTLKYADQNGVSVQMAARDLRYPWFQELAKQFGYNRIATAHHQNDALETVLLNLVRGTGLEGLTGISVRQQNIIRPILFATREMIMNYAIANEIAWREDVSNADVHYHRNLIRKEVIPLLKRINPALDQRIGNTLARLRGSWELVKNALEGFCKEAVLYEGFRILIKKDALYKRPYPSVLLWELLKDRGFNMDQCMDITEQQHQVGKLYYTASSQLTIDREYLLVDQREEYLPFCLTVHPGIDKVDGANCSITFKTIRLEDFQLLKDPNFAQVDAGTIKFPLIWRSWKSGDHFVPLGMKQHKKVSDFLVDEKIPLPDKESITVIESGGEIIWVVGRRISDNCRITEQTRQVLVMEVS